MADSTPAPSPQRAAPTPHGHGALDRSLACFGAAWLWVAVVFLVRMKWSAPQAIVTWVGVIGIAILWMRGLAALARHWSAPTIGMERWTSLGLLLLTIWPVGLFFVLGLMELSSD